MWQTIKDTLEEKHFVMAILTIAAGFAAHYGLNIDPATIALLLSPMMIAIGAHGWGAAAATTHAESVASLTESSHAASSSPPPPVPPPASSQASSQSGFARVGLLLALACVATLTSVSFVGCSPGARTTTINTTVATLDAAQTSLVTYAKDHEAALVAGASSLTDGQGKLATFRADVTKVELAIAAGYRLAAAATSANDTPTLTALAQGAQLVAAELTAIEKGLSP